VVIDCGAHVGVFTHKALERGARKVVAVEPNPLNVECLRRNFASEIAGGRVVVYPQGVWSADSTLSLSVSRNNTAMGSVVIDRHAGSIQVPLTTVDKIVAELNLETVDFIKMDIEGAEREALKGAAQTLGRFKPRLMLDSYHLADDPEVLPRIIAAAQPAYRMTCGACEPLDKDGSRWVPHVLYFSVR
jgi:FkbM family methyltransferase